MQYAVCKICSFVLNITVSLCVSPSVDLHEHKLGINPFLPKPMEFCLSLVYVIRSL